MLNDGIVQLEGSLQDDRHEIRCGSKVSHFSSLSIFLATTPPAPLPAGLYTSLRFEHSTNPFVFTTSLHRHGDFTTEDDYDVSANVDEIVSDARERFEDRKRAQQQAQLEAQGAGAGAGGEDVEMA